MAARGGSHRARSSGGGGGMPGPGAAPEEEVEDQQSAAHDRSLIISALVKQVKERKMSKGELFQELSSLQHHQRQPSRSPPDASSASSAGSSSVARRAHGRAESSSSTDGRLNREHGRLDSGDASLQDAGPGYRRMQSDQGSVGSSSRSSPQPPPGTGPVSGFWDPDRRALIQRLLEEKRKGSGAGNGSNMPPPAAAGGPPQPPTGSGSSSSSVNEGDGFVEGPGLRRGGLEIDTRPRPQQPQPQQQPMRGGHGRPGSSSSAARPSSAPRVGGHGRYPSYPARGSVSMDDSEVVRGAYRSSAAAEGVRGGRGGSGGGPSFRPKIRDLPQHYGRSMKEERDLSFHDRVMRWQRERQFEAARRREESEIKEVDGCTFHPAINAASRRSVESARLPGDHRSVNERLYDHMNKRKEQRDKSVAQAREDEEKRLRKECTFKPNLRTSAASLRFFSSRPGSPQVDRVTSRYLSSPQRVRYFAGVPAGMEECTFRPRTNPVQPHMGSARLYLEASVVERLTRHTAGGGTPLLNNSHAAGDSHYQGEGDALSPPPRMMRSPRSRPGQQEDEDDDDDSEGGMRALDRPAVMDLPSYISAIHTQPRTVTGTSPHHSWSSTRPSSAPTRRSRPPPGRGPDPHQQQQQGHHNNSHDDAYSMFNRAEREERRRAFHEFLARQTQRELHKQKKMKELAEKYQPKFNPKLSKLSMAIFQQQNKGSFLERMERDALKKERLADKLRLMREAADRACTFKPEITKKSAELQSRTPVEMSRGDLLRKETNARLLRLRFEKDRYSDFTFQPRLNQMNQMNMHVGSKLRILSEPDTYLDRLARELKRKADLSRRVQQEREMAELADCTFKPQTQDCPAFIKRIARSLALTKGVSGRSNETPERSKPEWR